MINNLFNIGESALNASQAWIAVTGNNLANADTEGYSRQYVDQKDVQGLTYKPGAQPLGVNAQQIMRFFDQFLERSYVRQNANSSRWDQQDTIMASLENIFNESNRVGLNSSLTNFFNAWQDLALRPDDTSTRKSLLSYADNLSDMFGKSMDAIKTIQDEMDVSIRQGVDRVNEIAGAIADLNRQITIQTIDGVSNPNSLLDKRDQLVRELSSYVDVETIDHGKGKFRVQLSTGQPLVDGVETYSLDVLAAKSEQHLVAGSTFNGDFTFDGTDNFEYTLEILDEKDADGNFQFRASIDGGSSWLVDENGKTSTFSIKQSLDADGKPAVDANGKPVYDPIQVKNLKITFTANNTNPLQFSNGDKFEITPKTGLYWIEPTRGPENITPQITMNGQDNPNRVTGGKLAAYFNIRDDNCGRYIDELDAVASSLIWEVNRIHSQGAGLDKLTEMQGQQRVENTSAALGSAQAMLPNGSKLQQGYVNFHLYDSDITDGNNYLASATLAFDPAKDSLEDVAKRIREMTFTDASGNQAIDADGNPYSLEAFIQDNKLIIRTKNDDRNLEFAMGEDSSGLMAGLGLNSFFSGTGAADIAVTSQIHQNTNYIAAGAVNGQHEVNVGDNITATAIGKLTDKAVTISTAWKSVSNQTIGQFYANLVTTVGADRRLSKTNTEYHGALTNDLYDRSASVSGVNVDEEMSNLIKYQHSYTAAAKLITTADQMLQTLLGLKQ